MTDDKLEWDDLHGYAGRCKTPFGWAIVVKRGQDFKLEVPWEPDYDFYGTVDECKEHLISDLGSRARLALSLLGEAH